MVALERVSESSTIDTAVQARVQAMLNELVSSGQETGLQVAAYLEGQLVVDAWAGVAKPETGERVQRDTLFITYSCSKGVTSTVIHQLVEAGKLDYDTPIAHYWPEFAANGKGAITVRHVLSHQAGIPYTPPNVTPEMLGDLDAMAHEIERMKPLWTPGTRTAYHGITFGPILGKLAERVDGRPFAQIVQEDICQPLGITDLFFGIPSELDSHVATSHGPRMPLLYLPPIFPIRQMAPKAVEPGKIWNHPAILHGVIPAGNMITTARSLARHYAALVGNGVDGVRLLTPERVKIATTLQTNGHDWVLMGAPMRKAMGYWLGGDGAAGSRLSAFGHTGMGGSDGFADPDYNFSFAIVKNKMTWFAAGETDAKVAHVIRQALNIPD